MDKIGQEPLGYWIWYGKYDEEFGISADNSLLIV